jgi:hypothetical protein
MVEEEELKQEDIVDAEKAKATYTHIDKSEADVTIFDPRGVSDYLRTYPELRNIPEFVNIRIDELKFVWWYANPTSPLVKGLNGNGIPKYGKDTNPANRANHAYVKVWGTSIEGRDEVRFNNFTSLRFTEPVRLAIEVMSKLDYTARYRAKKIADDVFTKYESLSKLDPENFRDGGENGTIDYVKYANVLKLVSSAMADLIRIKEHGFGVVEKGKKKPENESNEMFNEFLDEQS